MTTRLLAATLAALAGCGPSKPAPATAPVTLPGTGAEATAPPAEAAPPVAAPPAARKPEIGAWGFDLAGMDRAIAPGDSFFFHASGTWAKTTQIPADRSNYGMFTALGDRSDERTRKIVESASGAPGSDAQKIADFFKSFMDEAAIEAKGLQPIQARL